MKKYMARIFALCLAGAMMLSLAACGENNVSDATLASPNAGEGKLFTEPTELDITISSHISWPYNENWSVWKYIGEATGANLNITAIPNSDLDRKLSLMMASPETLPDLLHVWQKKTVDDYALSGAYVAYDDYAELLPDMYAFIDSMPEVERADILATRTSADGKMYAAPAYGTQTVQSLRTWMYRKDIFEKHGLAVPATTDELYQVAKKLKELYPDSYPICFRTGIGKFEEWGPSWQPYFTHNAYYDYNSGEWKLGATEPVMKEMVEYFLKLKNEGLVPPDYITMETKGWEELMSTDRGFITLDYIVRIDFFNTPNRQVNPDYTLAMMPPPKPNTAQASQSLHKTNQDFYAYTVCNTGRKQDIENAFKFVNWFYTDEAIDLISWGKEGETYNVVDGKKKFILNADEQPKAIYGIATYGTYQVIHTEANEALYSDEQVDACHEVLNYLMPRTNPTAWIPLSQEQQNEMLTLKNDLYNYISEGLSKFLLGQTPMSEWDNYQKTLKDMGADRLLEIYSDAYNTVAKAQ